MALFEWKNGKSGGTPLNAETLNLAQRELLELVFPIGATYITQDETNPKDILKFGVWERLKGKVALGIDEDDTNMDEIGKTGGEKTHTLTIDEMPSHRHDAGTSGTATPAIAKYKYETSGDGFQIASGSNGRYIISGMNYTGNSQPHNIMQPYEIVGYMWIRRK